MNEEWMNEEWWRMNEGWMKNDEGWMKDEWEMMKDEGCVMKDEGFKLLRGFASWRTDRRTDERTDICECRVAFATENWNMCFTMPPFLHNDKLTWVFIRNSVSVIVDKLIQIIYAFIQLEELNKGMGQINHKTLWNFTILRRHTETTLSCLQTLKAWRAIQSANRVILIQLWELYRSLLIHCHCDLRT